MCGDGITRFGDDVLAKLELQVTVPHIPIHEAQIVLRQQRYAFRGDAAGVDPLVGEGISFALAYGEVASAAIMAAFAAGDFSFADYARRILKHAIVGQLRLRARLARTSYRLRQPWLISLCWRLAPLLMHAIAWHNPQAVPPDDAPLLRCR